MGGDGLMCEICRQYICPSNCPNHIFKVIGRCEKCGQEILENEELWRDEDRNLFCSDDCAKQYYGIEEITDW